MKSISLQDTECFWSTLSNIISFCHFWWLDLSGSKKLANIDSWLMHNKLTWFPIGLIGIRSDFQSTNHQRCESKCVFLFILKGNFEHQVLHDVLTVHVWFITYIHQYILTATEVVKEEDVFDAICLSYSPGKILAQFSVLLLLVK